VIYLDHAVCFHVKFFPIQKKQLMCVSLEPVDQPSQLTGLIVVTQAGVHCLICTHDARGHALPDMYARCPRAHSARGLVRTYQAMHTCLCYN